MLRRLVVAALSALAFTVGVAQIGPYLRPSKLNVPHGSALPATCVVGDFFALDTDPTGQRIYYCETTNTWVRNSGGGGGGGTGTTDGGAITFITDATDDLSVGGSSFAASACYVDESAELLQCGGTGAPFVKVDGMNALVNVTAPANATPKPRIELTDSQSAKTFALTLVRTATPGRKSVV